MPSSRRRSWPNSDESKQQLVSDNKQWMPRAGGARDGVAERRDAPRRAQPAVLDAVARGAGLAVRKERALPRRAGEGRRPRCHAERRKVWLWARCSSESRSGGVGEHAAWWSTP